MAYALFHNHQQVGKSHSSRLDALFDGYKHNIATMKDHNFQTREFTVVLAAGWRVGEVFAMKANPGHK